MDDMWTIGAVGAVGIIALVTAVFLLIAWFGGTYDSIGDGE